MSSSFRLASDYRRYPEIDPPIIEAGKHLSDVIYSRKVIDAAGRARDLRAEISRSEGWMLRDLIQKDRQITRILEVGCAMGISSMFLSSGLSGRANPVHVIVDPFQTTYWGEIGMINMRKSGHDHARFMVEGSELALPRLLMEGACFDFAFIDGMHTFDHGSLDVFYACRLVRKGGYIAMDDVDASPLNKAVRYFSNYPNLEICASAGRPQIGGKRRMLNRAKSALGFGARLLGRKLASEFFDDSVVRPDTSLALDSSLLVFRKTADDERPIDWYARF